MKLILVDPDAGERARTARELRAAFPEADLIEISTVAELDRALERGRPDAVLTENQIDRLDGIGILGAVRRRFPHAAVLMVTAQRGERFAAGAMKAGFADILPKTEIDHLPAAVQESIDRARLRQAQEDEVLELRTAEQRYRIVSELTSDIAFEFVVSPDQSIRPRWVTEALARVTGYTTLEIEALGGWPRIVHPDDMEAAREHFERLLAGRPSAVEVRILHKKGGIRWLRAHARPLDWPAPGETGLRVIGAARDITERKETEGLIGRAGKMEAIGRLASGVVHDFNDVLMAVIGNADLLIEALPAGDARRARAQNVRDAASRGARLAKRLRALSLGRSIAPEPIDLNEAVRAIARTLTDPAGGRIVQEFRLAPRVWAVRAEPGEIEQVLLNLVQNAREAMPKGGNLTLATEDIVLDEAGCRRRPGLAPGPYVIVEVSDSGAGMSSEVLDHVFEPFFTTKMGASGLGLATVYGIVHRLGGDVTVASDLGQGTTVRIFLPAMDRDPLGLAGPAEPAAAGVPRGTGSVLVVEDDPAVLRLLLRELGWLGYEAHFAPSAEHALALVEATGFTFDLLLTDVALPGKGGLQLARTLGERYPGLRVLLVSGYAGEDVGGLESLPPGWRFLPKPFAVSALGAALRDLLGPQPAGEGQAPGEGQTPGVGPASRGSS